jgi:hypothetical protein
VTNQIGSLNYHDWDKCSRRVERLLEACVQNISFAPGMVDLM